MGIRFRITMALLLICLLVGAVTIYFYKPPVADPIFLGKNLSTWLGGAAPGFAQLPPSADVAIQAMGTNATPYLIRECGAEDSVFKELLLGAKKHGVPGLRGIDSADERRRRAALGLKALGRIGLQATIRGLTNTDKQVRWGCAASMVTVAQNSPSAVQPLLGCLSDSDARVRSQAAMALGMIGQKPDLVVPALVHSLGDTNDDVSSMAAFGLSFFRAKAEPAVPILVRMLTNTAPAHRFMVTNALVAIDLQAAARAGITAR